MFSLHARTEGRWVSANQTQAEHMSNQYVAHAQPRCQECLQKTAQNSPAFIARRVPVIAMPLRLLIAARRIRAIIRPHSL